MCHDWLLLNAVPNAFGTATKSDNNLFNLQNCMVRANTAFAMVAFAAAELEGDDFLALLVLVNDLGGHACAFDVGLADLDFLAVGHQQHVFQRDLLALLAVKEFDLQNVAGLDAILLGTCSYYCVHELSFSSWEGAKKIPEASASVNDYLTPELSLIWPAVP